MKIENSKNIVLKKMGEVFTPKFIVDMMLDELGYVDFLSISKKHIIDNSAGDGAFLVEIIRRYIMVCLKNDISLVNIKRELETYIHGIEISKKNYEKLIGNLEKVANEFNVKNVNWDILNDDTLLIKKYDGFMDYVVGNPPYVRIHNLTNQNTDSFLFSKKGMTDLYIVFFEIAFKMLSKKGKMAYITPNSWWTSLAGQCLREWILNNRKLYKLINFGHLQPFKNITSYTCISIFDFSKYFNSIKFVELSENSMQDYSYDDAFINKKMYFSKINGILKNIFNFDIDYIHVKNGYATCNDNFFIMNKFNPNISPIIPIIKASRGIKQECFYPYDENAKLISYNNFNDDTKQYIDLNINSFKYAFGKTQALADTYRAKIAINNLITSKKNSIKILEAPPGVGVYSGLYILTDLSINQIKTALNTEFFFRYVESLRKYKSGGCWTFNSTELQKFLNYYFFGKGF